MKKLVVTALAAAVLSAGTAIAADPKPATDPKAAPAAAPAAASEAARVEEAVALLRKDIRAQKADVLGKTMALDSTQAAAFWPVYKKYEAELQAAGDERVAILKDLGANLATMTDAKATELINRSIALEERKLGLTKKYKDEMLKVLPAKTVARFLQVDSRLNKLVDLAVAADVPLVQ